MKFLLDENLSPAHSRALRNQGYDAVSVVERGLSGADDSTVRSAAIAERRVLVTLDGDFANVLRYPPSSTPGVLRLRLHPATEEAIHQVLLDVIPRLAAIAMDGKLAVAAGGKIRIRS